MRASLFLLLSGLCACAVHLAEAGLDEHLAAGRPREAMEQLAEVDDAKLRAYERAVLLHLAQDWAASRKAFAEASTTRGGFAPSDDEAQHLAVLDALNGAMLGAPWPGALEALTAGANLVVVVEREPRTGCLQVDQASGSTYQGLCSAADAGASELRIDGAPLPVTLEPWLDERETLARAQEAKLDAVRSRALTHPLEALSQRAPIALGCRTAPQRLDVARLSLPPGRHVVLLSGGRRREALVDGPAKGRALVVLAP